MKNYPSASDISKCHLTSLTNLLIANSKGHYRKEKALIIRKAAQSSIGTCTAMQSLELTQTIERILLLHSQISVVEEKIEYIMKQIDSPMTTIPGISTQTAATIYAEIGDFSKYLNNSVYLFIFYYVKEGATAGNSSVIYAIEFFIAATALFVIIGKLVYHLSLKTPSSLFFLNPVLI